jgi:hypothetical protein
MFWTYREKRVGKVRGEGQDLVWILSKEKPGVSPIRESGNLEIEIPLTGCPVWMGWEGESGAHNATDLKLEGRVRRETFNANILRVESEKSWLGKRSPVQIDGLEDLLMDRFGGGVRRGGEYRDGFVKPSSKIEIIPTQQVLCKGQRVDEAREGKPRGALRFERFHTSCALGVCLAN